MALQLDGVQHIMRGMSQGAAIGNMLRRAALEEEALGRAKARQERETELQDRTHALDMLKLGAKPVQSGMVSEKLRAAAEYDSKKPHTLFAGPVEFDGLRPVNKAQIYSYKTAAGEERQYEIPTLDEQTKRVVEAERIKQEMLDAVKRKNLLELQKMGESPRSLEELREGGATLRTGMTTAAADARAADGRRSAAQIAEDTRKFTAAQNDLNRKSRERAAGMRASGAGGLTPAQERLRANDQKKQFENLQKQHDTAYAAEQKLWAEVESGKERVKAIDKELSVLGNAKGDTATRFKLGKERREVADKINSNTLRATGLGSRKKQFLQLKDALRGGAGTSDAADPLGIR